MLQFTGVPWLREHLGDLMRAYIKTLDVQINRGGAGALPSFPNPAKLYQTYREGGLMALVQNGEQRKIMDSVQAAMAVVEGYSEHVMDAVGENVLPEYAGLRDADGRPQGQPLNPGAHSSAPAGLRPEDAPVRGRQALL